jgi:N-acetylglutamate synthase-like GNAT family acetyltransferase
MEVVVSIQESIIQRPVLPGWINLVRLQLEKPEGISLIAEQGGEIVGFLFGNVKHGDFGLELSGWVETFGVRPKAMGEGVGRTLAETALNRFRELGVRDVYTAIRWDFGDLSAFFKSLGFGLSDFINLKLRLE